MSDDKQIAALLRERAALMQMGKTDRIEQVDAELKARGYKEPDVDEDKVRQHARRQQPQGRSTKPTQTAD